ncbi:MAG: hypothetical protein V1754_05140 [Pseudomonadota bacterium]
MKTRWTVYILSVALFSCGIQEDFSDDLLVDPSGKADNMSIVGPPTWADDSNTRVWLVKNQWEDRTTPAALKAGIAWPADSGLNWDEKFVKWISSLKKIDAFDQGYNYVYGYYTPQTYELSTPWGKKIPAPYLDCADSWIFLRVTFAAWYNLPFYMEDYVNGSRAYFGHFGIRTASGSAGPSFRSWYSDYSSMTAAQIQEQGWPQDNNLRNQMVYDEWGDEQPFIAPGARTGAFFDEIHLNKRVGYFTRLLLMQFGTFDLGGQSRNVYNPTASSVRQGDALLKRYSQDGVGHTYLILRTERNDAGKIAVEVASASMPPRQPDWESQAQSKGPFLESAAGGTGENYEGDSYAKLGGGLKRFRVAKKTSNGYWKNTVMVADQDSWISATDYENISKRPEQFGELIGEIAPEEKLQVLLNTIANARRHLRQYPASCATRTNRERAFDELYMLQAEYFGINKLETDLAYRKKEDYVFAELIYTISKTCCWNQSTSAMYELIMEYVDEQESHANQCQKPPVFKAINGGYSMFANYASYVGQGLDWVDWSEDENCPQRSTVTDTEMTPDWTDYCELNLWRTPSHQ